MGRLLRAALGTTKGAAYFGWSFYSQGTREAGNGVRTASESNSWTEAILAGEIPCHRVYEASKLGHPAYHRR